VTNAQRNWGNNRGLPSRVAEVASRFPDVFREDELLARNDDHHLANLLLHGASAALNDRSQELAPGQITFIAGPSPQHLANGLRHAFWSYQRLALLVCQRHNSEACVKVEKIYSAGWPRMQTVTEPAVRKAGRNGSCPCGSGRKAKVCHGDLLRSQPVRPPH
jgi:hypothetical protein